MPTGTAIRKNQYYDSVFLMGINHRLSLAEGVQQCAVLMGSDANKQVMAGLGFTGFEIDSATANDLVVAVAAQNLTALDTALGHLDEWLIEVKSQRVVSQIHTLDEALRTKPEANLVAISVPGEFAAREARISLEAGKHVFLFSDNVQIDDEVTLKRYARERGLLVMGPDCGTSLIGGVGLGFANVVRRGKIGAVAAAGTGLQEFTCLLHNRGYGISHAIGTGGRDLSDAVGGITTLTALDALENDPGTEVIAILSKPPGERTLSVLVERLKACRKPVIGCFLGARQGIEGEGTVFARAKVIDDAVEQSIRALGGVAEEGESPELRNFRRSRPRHSTQKTYLRGIFAGGTFCYQSQQIFQEANIQVYSNVPLDKRFALGHPDQSRMNSVVDMGDDYYLIGRPHPMIDGSQRSQRIVKEAGDPEVSILLLDFILGYNASRDPVGELADAIQEAKHKAQMRGAVLEVVGSICGTEGDPQDLSLQTRMLEDCGVVVFRSNAQATRYCVDLLKGAEHD